MTSISNMSLALGQMQSRSSGGFDFSILTQAGASGAGGAFPGGSARMALELADKNEAKQLEQIARQPVTKKEIERYTKVVKAATSLDDVLKDPVARKVFMKANGLGAFVDSLGLAKKALASDPDDPGSLARKLASINATWLEVAKKYAFKDFGVSVLCADSNIKEVAENYVGEMRLDMLDQQTPGLGSAILFKRTAANFDTPIKILGSALAREVVTTALSIPKQIALQSLLAQEKAISGRIDPKKLKDPEFADKIAQRYLINLNGGTGGITA
jgi:hypothetical protein